MPPKKRPLQLPQGRGRPIKSLSMSHDAANTDKDPSDNPQRLASVIPTRGRPPKRFKTEADDTVTSSTAAVIHQSFIMKLFDHSLDLAKYGPDSALYPICRAWMLNQPRSNKLINFKLRCIPPPEKRLTHANLLDDLRSGKVTEIRSMPALRRPTAGDIDRIPEPLPVNEPAGSLDLNYDLDEPNVSRDELLAAMKQRSTAVRKNWQAQTKKYQKQTCGRSFAVLECIYNQ